MFWDIYESGVHCRVDLDWKLIKAVKKPPPSFSGDPPFFGGWHSGRLKFDYLKRLGRSHLPPFSVWKRPVSQNREEGVPCDTETFFFCDSTSAFLRQASELSWAEPSVRFLVSSRALRPHQLGVKEKYIHPIEGLLLTPNPENVRVKRHLWASSEVLVAGWLPQFLIRLSEKRGVCLSCRGNAI